MLNLKENESAYHVGAYSQEDLQAIQDKWPDFDYFYPGCRLQIEGRQLFAVSRVMNDAYRLHMAIRHEFPTLSFSVH